VSIGGRTPWGAAPTICRGVGIGGVVSTRQHASLTLPATEQAPSQARTAIALACEGWPLRLIDIAKLLVSELVTNAYLHGEGAVEVDLWIDGRTLRVEVSDVGPDLPRWSQPARSNGEFGRGLAILTALADSSGSRPDAATGGKTVWFELHHPETS
jgi:anti-sigma regulatory factor (Ser/Thr protein kinase)